MEYVSGNKLWRVDDCEPCTGNGAIWYPGCGDMSAMCNACGGIGQTASYRDMDNGKSFGPWRAWVQGE